MFFQLKHQQSFPSSFFTNYSILAVKTSQSISNVATFICQPYFYGDKLSSHSLPQICLIFPDFSTRFCCFFLLEYSIPAFLPVSSYAFFKDSLKILLPKALLISTICYNLVNSSSIVCIFITVLKIFFFLVL